MLASFESDAHRAPADAPLALLGAVETIAAYSGRAQVTPADRDAVLEAAGFIRNPAVWSAPQIRMIAGVGPWYDTLGGLLSGLAGHEGDTTTLLRIAAHVQSAPVNVPQRMAVSLNELAAYASKSKLDLEDRAAIAYLARIAAGNPRRIPIP
jgi:hypothetical protein